ncbi:MAG: hypothetical protein M9890_06500 [Thermomicrobiales bacterium]|nr:hypothetical protein [Thermomicrobiales bacterium]
MSRAPIASNLMETVMMPPGAIPARVFGTGSILTVAGRRRPRARPPAGWLVMATPNSPMMPPAIDGPMMRIAFAPAELRRPRSPDGRARRATARTSAGRCH